MYTFTWKLEKIILTLHDTGGFSGGSDGKESACSVRNLCLISGSERSPRERDGNPPQYSCLENSMDREAWWATVHGVTKSQTQLSDWLTRHFIVSLQCWYLQGYSKVSQLHKHTHTHTHTFFFRFFSTMGYYKILNVTPWAILVIYLSYIQWCVSVNSKLLVYLSPHLPNIPFGNHTFVFIFYVCESISLSKISSFVS